MVTHWCLVAALVVQRCEFCILLVRHLDSTPCFVLLQWLGHHHNIAIRGDSGHPCLVPILKENIFNSLLLGMMFAVGFLWILCQIKEVSFYSWLAKYFHHE